MRQAVPPQIAVAPENLAAVLAVVGLDVGVRQQVGLQVAALVERPAAGGAFVGGFLQVQGLVDGQGACLAEALAALGTLERLLFGMDIPRGSEKGREKDHCLVNFIIWEERFRQCLPED